MQMYFTVLNDFAGVAGMAMNREKTHILMVKIPAKEFAAKYAAKREVYRFLTNDCKVYLSGYETMTIWHMRDLAMNRRKRIPLDAVKNIQIP